MGNRHTTKVNLQQTVDRNEWSTTSSECELCNVKLKSRRKHHCRNCGRAICNQCTESQYYQQKICVLCYSMICDQHPFNKSFNDSKLISYHVIIDKKQVYVEKTDDFKQFYKRCSFKQILIKITNINQISLFCQHLFRIIDAREVMIKQSISQHGNVDNVDNVDNTGYTFINKLFECAKIDDDDILNGLLKDNEEEDHQTATTITTIYNIASILKCAIVSRLYIQYVPPKQEYNLQKFCGILPLFMSALSYFWTSVHAIYHDDGVNRYFKMNKKIEIDGNQQKYDEILRVLFQRLHELNGEQISPSHYEMYAQGIAKMDPEQNYPINHNEFQTLIQNVLPQQQIQKCIKEMDYMINRWWSSTIIFDQRIKHCTTEKEREKIEYNLNEINKLVHDLIFNACNNYQILYGFAYFYKHGNRKENKDEILKTINSLTTDDVKSTIRWIIKNRKIIFVQIGQGIDIFSCPLNSYLLTKDGDNNTSFLIKYVKGTPNIINSNINGFSDNINNIELFINAMERIRKYAYYMIDDRINTNKYWPIQAEYKYFYLTYGVCSLFRYKCYKEYYMELHDFDSEQQAFLISTFKSDDDCGVFEKFVDEWFATRKFGENDEIINFKHLFSEIEILCTICPRMHYYHRCQLI